MAACTEAFLEDARGAGRPHCRTRASCWKRLERENVHASVGLADVWTVLERGLLLDVDRLKSRARRRATREGRMALARRDIFADFVAGARLLLAAHLQLTSPIWNTF